LEVFPNPAQSNGNVTIRLPNDLGICDLEVFTSLGERILSKSINSDDVLEGLTSGVYLVRVTKNGVVYQSKVVIQ